MPTQELKGIYQLFAVTPILVTCLIPYVLCIGILYAGRKYFEEIAYNVAFSSKYGDVALLGVVVIGVYILKEEVMVLPSLLQDGRYQVYCGIISILTGVICQVVVVQNMKTKMMVMDIWHQLFVIPLFIFMFLLFVPLIVLQGSAVQKSLAVFLFLVWAALVVVDIKYDRMYQQGYLMRQGYKSPVWNQPKARHTK